MSAGFSQLDVLAKTALAKNFIRKKGFREQSIDGGEVLALTNRGTPILFAMKHFDGLDDMLNLPKCEQPLNGGEILQKIYDHDDADFSMLGNIYYADLGQNQTRYVMMDLRSFVERMDLDTIETPAAMAYYLRNHLEKPLYIKSPTYSFSSEGLLQQYASTFEKFTGPTITLVSHNEMPLRIHGNISNRDFLILPAVSQVEEALSSYDKQDVGFLRDFEKQADQLLPRDGGEQYILCSYYRGQRQAIVTSVDGQEKLSGTVAQVVQSLNTRADSIPRHTRSPFIQSKNVGIHTFQPQKDDTELLNTHGGLDAPVEVNQKGLCELLNIEQEVYLRSIFNDLQSVDMQCFKMGNAAYCAFGAPEMVSFMDGIEVDSVNRSIVHTGELVKDLHKDSGTSIVFMEAAQGAKNQRTVAVVSDDNISGAIYRGAYLKFVAG